MRVDGRRPRDVIEWRCDRRGRHRARCRAGRARTELVVAKRAGEPLGAEVHSAVFDRVRTCDNHCEFCFIYQLPKGMRQQPVPEGRRLPTLLPVRQLHHADPLHRGRSRAGGHRASVAAARVDPRDRSRPAQPDAAEPARRDELALVARLARPRHRGARTGRGVPRRQRRRRARRTLARRARPVSRAARRCASCRSG